MLEEKSIYKIDKNIPIPSKLKYPFGEMEIGDSFEIDVGEDSTEHVSATTREAIWRFRKNHPLLKFSLRTIDEKHIRCWRIENKMESIDIVLKEIDQKRKEFIDLSKK
uniref:Uncharacterized protein n=1 Tax=viral metagenome TaxID=1070528 RepID=A0A6M3LZ78_9ZZZZ